MELTASQLAALNAKIPAGFRIEVIPNNKPRPVKVTQRRSEIESLDYETSLPARNTDKRPIREKKPKVYEEPEPKTKQGEAYKKVIKILHAIRKQPGAEIFYQSNEVPDDVINEPLDIKTIESKLKASEYESSFQFAMDVRQVLNNFFRQHPYGSKDYHDVLELGILFERLMVGNDSLVLSDNKDALQDLYNKVERMSREIKELHAQRGPIINAQKQLPRTTSQKAMTLQEKRMLGQSIRQLTPPQLRGMLEIVREATELNDDELVIDIESLPEKVCRELDNYVKNCLQQNARSSKKKKNDAVNLTGIMSAHEATSKKLKELDNQLEAIRNKSQNETLIHQPPEQPKQSESENESSSSSSSDDEDLPSLPPLGMDGFGTGYEGQGNFNVNNMWNSFQQVRLQGNEDDPDNGDEFGSMMDLDKTHDMFQRNQLFQDVTFLFIQINMQAQNAREGHQPEFTHNMKVQLVEKIRKLKTHQLSRLVSMIQQNISSDKEVVQININTLSNAVL